MSFAEPSFSKRQVRRAGDLLRDELGTQGEREWALQVLSNWRASHAYVINTFQSTLRQRMWQVDPHGVVGQRLKRAPSVIQKLRRFEGMKLDRMQDIAGVRAVTTTIAQLEELANLYTRHRARPAAESSKDYVWGPKDDGYRGLHLIFRYANSRAPESYQGLSIEMQLRTFTQHSWATAVEIVDAFTGERIKAGNPSPGWARFFLLAGAAFARYESAPWPYQLKGLGLGSVVEELAELEQELQVRHRLGAFSTALRNINLKERNGQHLVTLDTIARTVTVTTFPLERQQEANEAYSEAESQKAANVDVVLVPGGSLDALKKAYPNYFADARLFIKILTEVLDRYR